MDKLLAVQGEKFKPEKEAIKTVKEMTTAEYVRSCLDEAITTAVWISHAKNEEEPLESLEL